MRKALLGLGALMGVLTVVTLTAEGQSINQKKTAPDLKAGIVRETKYKEATVEKMLKAFAPAVKEQLRAGRSVTIDGVGTFQVVRIDEYEDLVNGRPAKIPARNYVEFVPSQELNEAASAEGAVPARTVKGYKFEINPNANPGMKAPNQRVPSTRIR